jgi:hypothetical protein
MLTPLSILSRDQGPTWQEPAPAAEETRTREGSPGRLNEFLRAVAARLAGLSRRPAPWRFRA